LIPVVADLSHLVDHMNRHHHIRSMRRLWHLLDCSLIMILLPIPQLNHCRHRLAGVHV
jgi:hypothetical protein